METAFRIIAMAIFGAIPVVATIIATRRLCRYQIARKRRVSYGTIPIGACCVPVLLAIALTLFDPEGWFLRTKGSSPQGILVVLAIILAICIPPALAVVVHYRKQGNSDETTVV